MFVLRKLHNLLIPTNQSLLIFSNAEQPSYLHANCLEFCHPHPITNLQLISWSTVGEAKKFQKVEDQEKNLEAIRGLMGKLAVGECCSMVVGEFGKSRGGVFNLKI